MTAVKRKFSTIDPNIIRILILISGLLPCGAAISQNNYPTRYIEVTGSAELEVIPDEIVLSIGIEEYLKESFDQNTQFRDYKKKATVNEIEQQLFSDLRKIGITKDQITANVTGNQWRYPQYGKDFLYSKKYDLTLNDFKMVDKVISTINTKGISNITIKELKSNNIAEYKKKVKTEALKAAKDKASYLLQSMDKKLGSIISITEISDDSDLWDKKDNSNNLTLPEYQDQQSNDIRNIMLRYEIKAKFEIE